MTDWPILSTVTFLPLVGVVLILFIRGESRAALKNIRSMKKGDTVVTQGGIIGKVVKASAKDDPEILVEIADNVQVKVVKSTLSSVTAKGQPAES